MRSCAADSACAGWKAMTITSPTTRRARRNADACLELDGSFTGGTPGPGGVHSPDLSSPSLCRPIPGVTLTYVSAMETGSVTPLLLRAGHACMSEAA